MQIQALGIVTESSTQRLGMNDALLPYRGKTLVERIINDASKDRTLVVHGCNQLQKTIPSIKHKLVRGTLQNNSDQSESSYALHCVYDLLQYAKKNEHEWIGVIQCCNLLKSEDLCTALEECSNEKVDSKIYYFTGEKKYPLLGVYHIDMISKIEVVLKSHESCLQTFVNNQSSVEVSLPAKWEGLCSFNSMAEYSAVCNYAQKFYSM